MQPGEKGERLARLELGADVEARDRGQGHPPLDWAVWNGHAPMVMFLIQKGSRVARGFLL